MEEWKEVKLGDVCLYNTEKIDLDLLDINNYISTENMQPNIGGITVSSNLPTSGNAIHFCNGDILISNIRPYFKKIWYANKEGGCSADVLCLRNNKNVDSLYLYYLLSQQVFFDYVMAGAKGCKMPRGDKQHIMNWQFAIPPLSTQQKIANILSSLDDKIEVNRRINENLEAQAQALFKSWFVDFEPFKDGEFVESELGMIPKGWRVVTINDIVYINKKTINPQKTPQIIYTHYSLPSFDNGMIPEIQKGSEIMSNKIILENNTTLFAKLNPRIKRVWFTNSVKDNSVCSTEFIPYRAINESEYSFVYALISSDSFYNSVMSFVNGATGSHQRFHVEDSLQLKYAINKDVINSFCKIINPILGRIHILKQEITRLASLRDTLLPKLMSGEVDVNDVKI